MGKKKKIDYIIERSYDRRLIFRFYPRQSSCHSFGDEPPKNWSDVYKIYYSYAVIKQWKFNPEDQWESEIMFYESCDECSEIEEVGQRCLLLADGIEVFKRDDGREIQLLDNRILPFGMGTNWTISKNTWTDWENESIKHTYYKFTLFDHFDKGYRFKIKQEDIKAFGEYLLGCCEYMLAHGDPI
jgi:hypothetical protein